MPDLYTPTVVDPGRMRQKVTLQVNAVLTPNPVGQNKPTWTTFNSYWAEVLTHGGDTSVSADQLKSQLTTTIIMRQFGVNGPPLSPINCRFLFKGRILNIISVIALDSSNAYWQIECKEQVGNTPTP